MRVKTPEWFFVSFILLFGFLLVFITPFGAGSDEDTHIGRIWEMSKGVLVPNRYLATGPKYPYTFYQISYRQDPNLSPVTWDVWKTQMSTRIDWDNFIPNHTRTRYFPSLYLPQAFIMGLLARVLDTPVGMIYLAIRLSYVISYAIFVYLAVRIIPKGKWVFGILAVTPMSLIQASSVSPDAVNNGIAFIFIAWILYLNSAQKKISFSRRDWYITAILVIAICTLKLNLVPLLLLLILVPRKKFGSKVWLVSFIIFTLVSFVVVCLGWNLLTASELLFSATEKTYNASEQIQRILGNPGQFLAALAQNIKNQFPEYIHDWIGISGYFYWSLPSPVYWLTMVIILFAVLSDGMEGLLTIGKRLWLTLIFMTIFLVTLILFYLLYNAPGTSFIPGVQGRYFLAIVPLLGIALLPNRALLHLKNIWLQTGLVLIGILTITGFFLVYHLPCGSAYYSRGLCELPRFKNWAPEISESLALSLNQQTSQTFNSDCQNLTQVKLWIREKGTTSSPLMVKVQSQESDEMIFSKLIPENEIPTSGWLVIKFPPVPDSRKKSFWIEAGGVDNDHPTVGIGYTSRDEYLAGQMSIGDTGQTGDLLFRYGCLVGLEEILHPIDQ